MLIKCLLCILYYFKSIMWSTFSSQVCEVGSSIMEAPRRQSVIQCYCANERQSWHSNPGGPALESCFNHSVPYCFIQKCVK